MGITMISSKGTKCAWCGSSFVFHVLITQFVDIFGFKCYMWSLFSLLRLLSGSAIKQSELLKSCWLSRGHVTVLLFIIRGKLFVWEASANLPLLTYFFIKLIVRLRCLFSSSRYPQYWILDEDVAHFRFELWGERRTAVVELGTGRLRKLNSWS